MVLYLLPVDLLFLVGSSFQPNPFLGQFIMTGALGQTYGFSRDYDDEPSLLSSVFWFPKPFWVLVLVCISKLCSLACLCYLCKLCDGMLVSWTIICQSRFTISVLIIQQQQSLGSKMIWDRLTWSVIRNCFKPRHLHITMSVLIILRKKSDASLLAFAWYISAVFGF